MQISNWQILLASTPVAVAIIGVIIAMRSLGVNIKVQKAKICADLFKSQGEFGLATGALVGKPNTPEIDLQSLHQKDEYRRVLESFHEYNHNLDVFVMLMPVKFHSYGEKLRSGSYKVFNIFRTGKFDELKGVWQADIEDHMTELKQKLKTELNMGASIHIFGKL